MDGSEYKRKGKSEPIDLDARARITLAATADIDESENARISNEENLTSEQIKDYLEDVLEEIKGTKNKTNKDNQKDQD